MEEHYDMVFEEEPFSRGRKQGIQVALNKLKNELSYPVPIVSRSRVGNSTSNKSTSPDRFRTIKSATLNNSTRKSNRLPLPNLKLDIEDLLQHLLEEEKKNPFKKAETHLPPPRPTSKGMKSVRFSQQSPL